MHAFSQERYPRAQSRGLISGITRALVFHECPTVLRPLDIRMFRSISAVKIDHLAIGMRIVIDKTHDGFCHANGNPLCGEHVWSCCHNQFSFERCVSNPWHYTGFPRFFPLCPSVPTQPSFPRRAQLPGVLVALFMPPAVLAGEASRPRAPA